MTTPLARRLSLLILLLSASTAKAEPSKMDWWRDARYGMFIHWGLYAVPAGTWTGRDADTHYSGGLGEWLMHDAKVPVADYAAIAPTFNPTAFDADAIVATAKSAGMKYIVITAKHHDGFAMYHSSVDGFNIYDGTPFKRDPVAELSAACKKAGIKFGVYYSQAQDWHHPGGAAAGGHWDKAQDGDFDKYLADIAVPQIKELLEKYDPAVVWFDTPFEMTPARAKPIADLMAQHPNVIFNDRLGGGFDGDTTTPEQHIPANGFKNRDWETCMTINDTWGYKSKDTHWKSTRTILHNLVDIASKGGNYLLNVGPDATGVIPQPEVDRLKEVGDWLKVNGDAVYGTTGSPFKKQLPWGRVTQKPGKLYLTVFDIPSDGKLHIPMSTKITSATLLSPHIFLDFGINNTADGATITVPDEAYLKHDFVFVANIDGPVVPIDQTIKPAADGSITLSAADAELSGGLQLQGDGGSQNIGYWTDKSAAVKWTAAIPEGNYKVELTYACEDGTADSVVEFGFMGKPGAGSTSFAWDVVATGGWDKFVTKTVGTITVGPGEHRITVRAKSMPHFAVMNLKSVKLIKA